MWRIKRLPIQRAGEKKEELQFQRSDAEVANNTGRSVKSQSKSQDFGAARLQDSILKSRATAFVGRLWAGAGSLGGATGTLSDGEMRAWGELANENVSKPPVFEVNLAKAPAKRDDDD
jgi:hypothetical protein